VKKNGFTLALILLALLFCMTGCVSTQKLGDFTLLSSRNVELSRAGEFRQSSTEVEGKDVRNWLFGIPLKAGDTDLKGAVDAALTKVPGAVAVVDPRFSYRSFRIPFLFGSIYRSEGFYVKGTVLVDPNRM
jgi:hypothetical protein